MFDTLVTDLSAVGVIRVKIPGLYLFDGVLLDGLVLTEFDAAVLFGVDNLELYELDYVYEEPKMK